jgi:acetyl-CoA carboxylase carboxyl transferase subunit alpha
LFFKERAAEVLKLTAEDMLENKLIDGIIKEPLGGAHSQIDEMHQITKTEIKKHLAKLTPMNAEKRSEKRIAKFCAMGVFNEGVE